MNDRTGLIEALENVLGRLMLIGVIFSAVCLSSGLAMWIAGRQASGILRIGLVVLLATPMLRVTVSLVEAIRLRDWLFFATALSVVLLIAATILLSFRAAGA